MIPDINGGSLHLSAHVALTCANIEDDEDDTMSSDSDFSYFEDDESLMEMEEKVKEYSVVGKTPALAAMFFDTQNLKCTAQRAYKTDAVSCDGFEFEEESDVFKMRKSLSDVCIQSMNHNPQQNDKSPSKSENSVKPEVVLKSLLAAKGVTMETRKSNSMNDFFVPFKPIDYDSYNNEIARAVREGDLATLKRHVKSGKSVVCCNKFKESIVHTICRRGHKNLLEFILYLTDASIQICDDQGRTPLHDAAWTHEPNFEMVTMLLRRCPQLLLIEDNRGFTPLSYVGKQCWDDWCTFLRLNEDLLPIEAL